MLMLTRKHASRENNFKKSFKRFLNVLPRAGFQTGLIFCGKELKLETFIISTKLLKPHHHTQTKPSIIICKGFVQGFKIYFDPFLFLKKKSIFFKKYEI